MDSGSAAPTLMLGVRETLAEKDLMTAMLRCGAAVVAVPFGFSTRDPRSGPRVSIAFNFPMAFRFAADKAGRRRLATREMMTMTTRSSMSVKAREAEAFIQLPVFACY